MYNALYALAVVVDKLANLINNGAVNVRSILVILAVDASVK